MTNETEDEEFIALADMDAWEEFWDNNGEFLDIDRQTAFDMACNCSLVVGGGAAPLFRVGFVDREETDIDRLIADGERGVDEAFYGER